MDDESSSKKKKKRARSLIFKYCFRKSGSSRSDDPSSSGKVLASDDNLVYCDVSTNGNSVDSDKSTKKSSSSRGRMSRIFKAVLFDTAMKKKMRSKKSIKATSASAGSSPIPYDFPKTDEIFNENMIVNSSIKKISDAEDSSNSNDHSSQIVLSPKVAAPATIVMPTAALPATAPAAMPATAPAALPATAPATLPLVPSSPSSPITANPQIVQTERKLTSRVDSMKKKPPLPPYSRVESIKKKQIPATTTATAAATTTPPPPRDRKPAKGANKPKVRLCLLILLSLFVTVALWTIYAAIATEPSDIDADPYTDIVITGDEL